MKLMKTSLDGFTLYLGLAEFRVVTQQVFAKGTLMYALLHMGVPLTLYHVCRYKGHSMISTEFFRMDDK